MGKARVTSFFGDSFELELSLLIYHTSREDTSELKLIEKIVIDVLKTTGKDAVPLVGRISW